MTTDLFVSVGLHVEESTILVQQRPADSLLGGLWELPGGKVEEGETLREGLKREWFEELGVRVEVGDMLTMCEITFPVIGNAFLPLFAVTFRDQVPMAQIGQVLRWVTYEEMIALPGVPTMRRYATTIMGYMMSPECLLT